MVFFFVCLGFFISPTPPLERALQYSIKKAEEVRSFRVKNRDHLCKGFFVYLFILKKKTTALILGKSIMNPEGTKEKWILYIPM